MTGKTKADTKVSIVNADNIVEATKLLKEQQLSEQSKRDLINASLRLFKAITSVAVEFLSFETIVLNKSLSLKTLFENRL